MHSACSQYGAGEAESCIWLVLLFEGWRRAWQYLLSNPPPKSHPARLVFQLLCRGMCFAPVHLFSLPPSPPSPLSSPLRTCSTGTPTSSLKNQQPLMLDEGKRSLEEGEQRERGRCFPLDRLLRMHDESSQTDRLTCWEKGGDEKQQTFFPKDRQKVITKAE